VAGGATGVRWRWCARFDFADGAACGECPEWPVLGCGLLLLLGCGLLVPGLFPAGDFAEAEPLPGEKVVGEGDGEDPAHPATEAEPRMAKVAQLATASLAFSMARTLTVPIF
jgi:hypothetical protein